MSFQVGIGSLVGTVFFQVGLCTPLQAMRIEARFFLFSQMLLFVFLFLFFCFFFEGSLGRKVAQYVSLSEFLCLFCFALFFLTFATSQIKYGCLSQKLLLFIKAGGAIKRMIEASRTVIEW